MCNVKTKIEAVVPSFKDTRSVTQMLRTPFCKHAYMYRIQHLAKQSTFM